MCELEWYTALERADAGAHDLPGRLRQCAVLGAHEVAWSRMCWRFVKLAWFGWKSREMRIDDQRSPCARERLAHRFQAEVARGRGIAGLMRVTSHHDSDRETVGVKRLEFLEAARRNVRGVIDPGDAMLACRAIDLERRQILLARDQRRRVSRETLQFIERAHQTGLVSVRLFGP